MKNVYKTKYQNFNVFIINDGMDKETIKEFKKTSYENCELINYPERLGKTKCMNNFLAKTNSEYIIFSDVDTFTEAKQGSVYSKGGEVIVPGSGETAEDISIASVVENFQLINKVYIPKYIFPLSKCLFSGINLLLTMIPWFLIILLSYFGLGKFTCYINVYYLLIPFILILLFLFTVGVSFILSTISVFLRDMFYIYGILLTIWQYFTPIFYSVSMLPENLQKLFILNPLYLYIDSIRSIVLYSQMPSAFNLIMGSIIAVIVLVLGMYVFKKKQYEFIYYI